MTQREGRDYEAEAARASIARRLFDVDSALPRVGRFEIQEKIGAGGMGVVYRAIDPKLEREVALKVLSGARAERKDGPERMLREARALARLSHPNVVSIHEVGTTDKSVYIAMELLRGETLADRIAREGALPATRALPILRDVCAAVGRAHAAGIIHRDLKPENVFIVPAGEGGLEHAKVLDFGIAKVLSAGTLDFSTRTGTVLGTPHYMSPEATRSARDVDARSDLWAIGIMAYECLVGERPFLARSVATLAVKIVEGKIPVPSRHADVPAGFDGWFARATQRDPDLRFRSADEMARALEEALDDRKTGRGPVARAAPLAVVAVAILAVGIALTGGPSDEVPQRPAAKAPLLVPASEPSSSTTAPARRTEPPIEPEPDPEPVTLTLIGSPPNTKVYRDDTVIGTVPGPVTLPFGTAPITLTIKARGHQSDTLEFVPDRDRRREFELERRSPSPVPKPPSQGGNPDDIER